ncbi:hypothetical protein RFI_22116 [Reticulomyxa filosa]|uniref:Uncharacterized protein n=1 Tax=Reticulomyxa filosa TaxID=46433 RepID=X6MP75_RETFI|nr:hypothetical protein RFI_22116 [Reticulomyxa filosa]|eukprot:ETO15247.1 hypothetical protein RFI_22116 [Reticulomyxa filosa]
MKKRKKNGKKNGKKKKKKWKKKRKKIGKEKRDIVPDDLEDVLEVAKRRVDESGKERRYGTATAEETGNLCDYSWRKKGTDEQAKIDSCGSIAFYGLGITIELRRQIATIELIVYVRIIATWNFGRVLMVVSANNIADNLSIGAARFENKFSNKKKKECVVISHKMITISKLWLKGDEEEKQFCIALDLIERKKTRSRPVLLNLVMNCLFMSEKAQIRHSWTWT